MVDLQGNLPRMRMMLAPAQSSSSWMNLTIRAIHCSIPTWSHSTGRHCWRTITSPSPKRTFVL